MTPPSVASTGSPPAPETLRVRTARAARPVCPLRLASLPGRRETAALRVRGWTVVVGEPLAVVHEPDGLARLAENCGWRAPRDPTAPPFLGGAVGLLTDEAATPWLALPPDPRPDPHGLPPLRFAVHDSAVCLPPDGGAPWLVAAELPGWSRRPAGERLAELRALVGDAASADPLHAPAPTGPGPLWRSLTPQAHRAGVERVLAWIRDGDLYQLNLTLQLGVAWAAPGVTLARRLWDASPDAPHAAYLEAGTSEVVSVSPETFLRSDGDEVVVRPIKGTRARRADPAADAAAAAALRASAKDAAEHVMIVDLERNDLGRVSEPGSVRVPELAALEAHPTVWHLTSTVRGRLRPETSLVDLLAATLPCGSVTGAPKRMAVARTRLLEPVRRGAYCGAIGVVSQGLVDLSVGIRTAVRARGVARYGVGGGIVADSDPAAEHAEAMDKAAAFLRATGVSPHHVRRPRRPGHEG